MGYRLSKIYTRTGDTGTTGLGDGSRVAKNSLRVHAFGDIDELNSHLGNLLSFSELVPEIRQPLLRIQNDLFDFGGELCLPGQAVMEEADVLRLEELIDHFNKDLPPLKNFILPGGSAAASQCHIARAVCRRAERTLWTLADKETVNPTSLRYLNRLSDLLFVLARVIARANGNEEILWQPRERR